MECKCCTICLELKFFLYIGHFFFDFVYELLTEIQQNLYICVMFEVRWQSDLLLVSVDLLQMLEMNITIAFPAAPLLTVILALVGKTPSSI